MLGKDGAADGDRELGGATWTPQAAATMPMTPIAARLSMARRDSVDIG